MLVLACSYAELSPGVSGFRALEVLELVSAHWCVYPGGLLTDVCPLVGRAGLGPVHSGGQGQVPGICWLRGAFGNRPAYRWDCISDGLVALPEATNYWCQQANGLGWVPGLIS